MSTQHFCKGKPFDPDKSVYTVCPLRNRCLRYLQWDGKSNAEQGPYDDYDETCSMFFSTE